MFGKGKKTCLSTEGPMGASSPFNLLTALPGRRYNLCFSRRKQIEWPEDLSFKISSSALLYQSPCSLHCTIFQKAEAGYPKGRFRTPALPEHPLSLTAPPPGWGWGERESFSITKFICTQKPQILNSSYFLWFVALS